MYALQPWGRRGWGGGGGDSWLLAGACGGESASFEDNAAARLGVVVVLVARVEVHEGAVEGDLGGGDVEEHAAVGEEGLVGLHEGGGGVGKGMEGCHGDVLGMAFWCHEPEQIMGKGGPAGGPEVEWECGPLHTEMCGDPSD